MDYWLNRTAQKKKPDSSIRVKPNCETQADRFSLLVIDQSLHNYANWSKYEW